MLYPGILISPQTQPHQYTNIEYIGYAPIIPFFLGEITTPHFIQDAPYKDKHAYYGMDWYNEENLQNVACSLWKNINALFVWFMI
jgi:hypothetical protein